jgi:Flp pilus assembly protein TadB
VTELLLLAAFAAGAGLAAGAAAYAAAGLAAGLRLPLPSGRRRERVERPKARRAADAGANRALLAGGLAGGAIGALAAMGGPNLANAAAIGSLAGSLLGWYVRRNLLETRKLRLLREVAVLYESVHFFTEAGYTIPQAMRLASVSAPNLRPCVERCLARYSRERARAFEELARETGLSEAALLTAVLVHAEDSGLAFGQAALQEEGRNLEELRKTLAELRVMSKPLYFAIYRGLPLVAVGGVMTGPLVYRLVKMMQFLSGGG